MRFRVISENGVSEQDFRIRRLFIIGYAGRDTAAQEKHIRELGEQFGIPAPTHTPMIYECDPCLLVQKERQFLIGSKTSGEAECVLIFQNSSIFVGVGSDHTDRELEVSSVPKSKQVCPKPVSRELWDYTEVRDHWDSLQLRSWQSGGEAEYPYQNGGLAELITAERVMDELRKRAGRLDGCAVYCGTVPVIGRIHGDAHFRCELRDPVLDRSISCAYTADTCGID